MCENKKPKIRHLKRYPFPFKLKTDCGTIFLKGIICSKSSHLVNHARHCRQAVKYFHQQISLFVTFKIYGKNPLTVVALSLNIHFSLFIRTNALAFLCKFSFSIYLVLFFVNGMQQLNI